jgi:AcrR family transcriptional regulator
MSATKGTATKQRILEATTELLSRRGYAATGLKDIVQAGEAPSGSVYHFFPGGKEQLGVESLAYFGQELCAEIAGLHAVADIPVAIEAYFARRAHLMEKTGWESGCPLAVGTLESMNDRIGRACADVFGDIRDTLASVFTAAGLAPGEAGQLGTFVLVAFEGGCVISKAFRSADPLVNAGREVAATIRTHLPAVTAA